MAAVLIAFSTLYVPWTMVTSQGVVLAHLAPADFATAVGETYGPCKCPPWAELVNQSLQGTPMDAPKVEALQALVPSLVSPTLLAAGAWMFPAAILLAFLALVRRKVMLVSGALFLASGVAWIAGSSAASGHMNTVLAPSTASIYLGPYLSLVSGAVLFAGYFLARREWTP